MSIGTRITDLRKEQGLSQVQLAQMLDVTRQAVSKWENDQTAPDTLKLIQLADILSTDVEYLATGVRSAAPAPSVVTVEKIVEKPIEIEKIVEIERIVETIVEKPVIRKVKRIQYVRNPIEYTMIAIAGFLLGLLIGLIL